MAHRKDLKVVILNGGEKTNGSVQHSRASGVSKGRTIQGHIQDFCFYPEGAH